MTRYLVRVVACTSLIVALVATINAVVDPYRLFRFVEVRGFNAIKPQAGTHGGTVKPYQVIDAPPATLILGNSRAEMGFDPDDPVWSADQRPVYNIALPGSGPSIALQMLRHTLAAADARGAPPPRTVIWGLDFSDFLLDGSTARGPSPPHSTIDRLLVDGEGHPNRSRWIATLHERAEALVTLGALVDSALTVAAQHRPAQSDLTGAGFNPMRNYVAVTANETAWSVFHDKDKAQVVAYRGRGRDVVQRDRASSPDLDDVRAVIAICRERRIDLKLVIYPFHARLLEIIRLVGAWDAFEAWKREIVRLVEAESAASGAAAYPVWDFSAFDAYTTEAVPARSDHAATMRWYWESGHFKRELGTLMLMRMLDRPGTIDPTFGTLLTSRNVDAQLDAMRADELRYRETHPADMAELERLVR